MKNNVIFVGAINLGNPPDDGETMKNVILSNEIQKYVDKLYLIDTRNRLKRLFYLLKMFGLLIMERDIKIVLSASSPGVYKILKVMRILKVNQNNIYYWVIGGNFGNLIERKEINSALYKGINTIIVEGASMKSQLEKAGFKNCMVLPNVKPIHYLPALKPKSAKPTRFVFLSRVMPQKGVDYIIDAAHKLRDNGIKDFIVDIYGSIDSAYKSDFYKRIQDDKNIFYKGFLMLNENKGYDILASYDVMLFPTYWYGEGFPGIIIDAFMSGLPVIASQWNLNTSLIKDQYNGVIIPVHNVDALADAMKNFMTGKMDIDVMSANAQKDAMNYDVSNVVSETLLKRINLI